MSRPLAALRHTPKEVSKAVVEALFQINKTHEAAIAGKYSSWIPPLSYASLNFMQRSLGWIAPPPPAALSTSAAASTGFVALGQCTRSDNFYNAIVCTYIQLSYLQKKKRKGRLNILYGSSFFFWFYITEKCLLNVW